MLKLVLKHDLENFEKLNFKKDLCFNFFDRTFQNDVVELGRDTLYTKTILTVLVFV